MFSAIFPKTSKIIQKSLSFQDFLSEMLRRKCSSGNVKSSSDKPEKNFPVKMQFFLVKFQKRRKTNFLRVFFDVFPSVHLITVSTHLTIFLSKSEKKLTQSPKRDDARINYFCYFFSEFCYGHVKCTFSNPIKCHNFFAKRRLFSLREQKRSNNYYSLQKNIKTFRCIRGLQFWEVWHQTPAKNPIISLNDQKIWAKILHLKGTSYPKNVPLNTLNVVSFDNPARIFFSNCSNFSAPSPKMILKKNNFSKNFFLQFFLL